VVYDFEADWPSLYDDHSILAAARHLEAADVVVSFRGEAFDVPCMEGLAGRRLRLREHIDLYAWIARANAQRGIVGTKGDFTLDAVCRRTLGRGKNGSGAHAPDLAVAGRFGELFNYCLHDVRLTRDLLLRIARDGGIRNLNGGHLALELPEWVKRGLSVRNELSDPA
jgi:hypothetical protein